MSATMGIGACIVGMLSWHAPMAPPRLRQRPHITMVQVVDLFPDPPSVGGNVVQAPDTSYPMALEQPAEIARRIITPAPDILSVFTAPIEGADLLGAAVLGVALMLGPDFLLAPAGLVSDRGIRPGYELQSVVGSLLTPDAEWLADRREDLAVRAPLIVTTPVALLFFAAGLLLDRLLLLTLEDVNFVVSTGICATIGSCSLEIIREPLPTREERDTLLKLKDEFNTFAVERLTPAGRCHENEIIKEFRAFFPRYRRRDMGRTTDGVSLSDDKIGELVGAWNRDVGRPGERTPRGYWKGISVAAVRPEGR